MTKISINDNKDNSPRKQFVKDFNIAFAKGDMDYVLNCFSDDIVWNVINHEPVHGKDAVAKMLQQMDEVADELVIDSILNEDDTCAVNGKLTYAGVTIAFSDLYTFNQSEDLKIKHLTGYAIELGAQ